MSNLKKVLGIVKKASANRKPLSNKSIIFILDALKNTSNHKTYKKTFLYLNTTLNTKVNEKFNFLTNREKQILHLIGIGKDNNTIANELELSTSTIETHRKNIRKKLNLIGKGKLIEFAILNNIVQLNNSLKPNKKTII